MYDLICKADNAEGVLVHSEQARRAFKNRLGLEADHPGARVPSMPTRSTSHIGMSALTIDIISVACTFSVAMERIPSALSLFLSGLASETLIITYLYAYGRSAVIFNDALIFARSCQ
jgi:hypothetical protein